MQAKFSARDARELRLVLAAARTSPLRSLTARLGSGFVLCAVEESTDAAVAAVMAHQPDVCLLAIDLPEPPLATAARIIEAAPRAKVLVVVDCVNDDDCLDYLLAGASGYVAGDGGRAALAFAVRAVAAGLAIVPPTAQRRLLEELRR
jgi:DNA-binding NarL/FixJ family response regulator